MLISISLNVQYYILHIKIFVYIKFSAYYNNMYVIFWLGQDII